MRVTSLILIFTTAALAGAPHANECRAPVSARPNLSARSAAPHRAPEAVDFIGGRAALPRASKVRQAESRERGTPLDVEQIRELIGVMPDAGIARQISGRGINFRISADLVSRLEGAGAGVETLTALRRFLSNNAPEVTLRVREAKVTAGTSLSLSAEAFDADSDEVQYRWLSNAGNISGDGPEVVLDTSGISVGRERIQVTVSVTVSDRKGGFASDTGIVTVEGRRADDGGDAAEGAVVGMSLKVVNEGKYLVVSLSGKAAPAPGPVGAIEVSLGPGGGTAGVKKLTGILPGVPCRVDFVGLNNVAEGSFVEPPGIANEWGTVVVRIRVKDPKRVVNFVVGWKVLNESLAR